MYVRDPLRVVVTGPLATYAAGFCAELERQGYASQPASELVQLMAHVSRWLDGQGLITQELTEEVIDRFLADRRGRYRKFRTRRGLRPLLTYLRRIGVVPSAEPALHDISTDVALLVEEYCRFLVNERGLAEVSIRRYLPAVRIFLAGLPSPLEVGLGLLSAGQVSRFVIDQAGQRSVPDAKSMVTALRSLLRFLFLTGRIDREFAAAVPTVANRKLSTLPGRLRAGEAGLLMGSCDRDTGSGRRDCAILTVLARLGLRACEAAAMQLGDIDWRAGELTVHGKGGLDDKLPLPADVGEALVDYLRHGRPADPAATSVFLTVLAPRQGITADGIRGVVARACQRAGIPRTGAHRLRHTVASDLLAAGSALPEIGQVLRHRSQLSTATYAKIDRSRLRELARPWPGGPR
jgi:site-specific recombinase XerD